MCGIACVCSGSTIAGQEKSYTICQCPERIKECDAGLAAEGKKQLAASCLAIGEVVVVVIALGDGWTLKVSFKACGVGQEEQHVVVKGEVATVM